MTFLKSILRLFSEKQREVIRYWLKSIPAYFYQNNLSKLAKLYGTDKYEHGYTEIYQQYFKNIKHKKLRILEIGIGGGENTKYGGNSLKMWAKYFPKSDIFGIDLYDKSLIDYRRIKTFQGSQSDENFLAQFQNLDIIIDDGSHMNSDVIQSFEILFSKLNAG
jgi:tRNA G46 methylase TrmB